MSNRPTSRQFQGHFNALRATRSHTVAETIDIAPGNYGSGKVFPGAVGLSAPSWVSATNTFYVFINRHDELVLDETFCFPLLCTKIARVVMAAGIIMDVIDERAEVNGLVDAYYVAFDDAGMQIATPAADVQAALALLDAYLAAEMAPALKYVDLDVGGGIKNGLVKYSHLDDAPAIEFPKRPTGVGRVRYSVSVPRDWVPGTDIVFRIFWSPEDAGAGDVHWRISYRRISIGNNVSAPMTTVSVIQATPAATNIMLDTGNDLVIQASNINAEDLITINFEREYSIQDTYSSTVRMHLVRMEYMEE